MAEKEVRTIKETNLICCFVGLTWVAPLLNGCVASAVGWFGAKGAKEPGATVDGGLVLVLPLLPLMSSTTLEPGVCRV